MSGKMLLVACVLAAAGAAHAQAPIYSLPASARPGNVLIGNISGKPAQPFVALIDLDGGPLTAFGETFYLGLTPMLQGFWAGTLDAMGKRPVAYRVASSTAVVGLAFYSQVVVLDASSSNGLFRTSGGESFGVHQSAGAIVERFDDPVAAGYVGSYDTSVKGRLQAGPVRFRSKNTIDPQGVPFPQPIQGALTPSGARYQLVFRAKDLGATGAEELITAVRWKPFGAVQQDLFRDFALEMGHSQIVPDYTVDRVSALPKFPFSGLKRIFAQNFKPGDPVGVVTMSRGPYLIHPALVRPDGYLPFPAFQQAFPYNGVDSLVLDQKVAPDSRATGINGHRISLMVQSSPRPDARSFARGTATRTLDPHVTKIAQNGDNSLVDFQFEFARVKTTARSPWLRAPKSNPDYKAAIIAASVPAGARYAVEYRGASDARGSNATAWSADINVADGSGWIQYRVALTGDLDSGAVPSIDTVVIPVD